jgi:hypothetical protein
MATQPYVVGSAIPANSYMVSNGNGNLGWSNTTNSSAIQINGNNGPVLTFDQDGIITTPGGKFHVDEWTDTIKIVRLLVCTMAEDDEVCAKYPFIREYAHEWMMKGLKG